MKQVFLYARVSSVEQQKEGFSIPAQLKLLHEYAQRHGFTVAGEYTDAETAKKAGRTNFKAMIDDVLKNKDIKAILVEKTDRLTRNFQDYVLIDDLIQKRDIEVHLAKEGEILSQRAKSHTKLIHGIKVVLAKNFIDNLSEETAKGMLEKAAQGHWPTTAPYGYKNNKQIKRVELDTEKSAYVKRAFELYATGHFSLKNLVNALYFEGYLFRASTAKPSLSNIHHILTNPFYTGQFVFKGMHYVGHHPAIVSKDLFNEVQHQLKLANKPDYQNRTIAFSGLLTCGHCGCAVTGDIKQKGRYVYYRCTHHKQKCPDKYIRQEVLSEQFAKVVQRLTITPDQYQWMVDGLKEINAVKDEEVSDRLADIGTEIKRAQGRLSQMYEDKLDGVIDEALYRKKSREGRRRIEELEATLAKLNRAADEQMTLGLQILEFAKDAHTLFLRVPAHEQAKLLQIVFSKCELKAGEVRPELKKPFDVLLQNPENERNYPQGNSNPCRLREREVS